MFRSSAPTMESAGKGSAITKGISAIGTALGIGAAILLTPILFEWTRQPLLNHLLETWNAGLANLLTWVMGGVEAFIIYGGTKLFFTLLTIWTTAALAARRFPGS
jgi:hypothetical protein